MLVGRRYLYQGHIWWQYPFSEQLRYLAEEDRNIISIITIYYGTVGGGYEEAVYVETLPVCRIIEIYVAEGGYAGEFYIT